jgi:23S rRNA (guanosine2251-2'-O)-methyltransferase
LTALAGFDGHQGVALVVEPRQFASLDDVLARAAERGEPPFILVLDSLEDPHNVGTLLRSAEAAGVHGVLFPTHRQAPLSPSAVKASAGAIEHLLLCPVDDLPAALSDLHSRGVRIAGAEGDAPMTARQSDLRGPLAIVVGSEGQGLGPAVRRRADLFMRIPMKGAVGSLNAAVAGSILLFEALAQRDPNATPRAPLELGEPDSAVTEPAPEPKPRVRKGLSTEPPEPDETAALAEPDAADPDPAAVDVAPAEPAAAETTIPKRRGRKGLSTEPAEPAATQPAATKRTATKPRATKPAATKPTATKPAATKPAATKPAATKPAATKPAATKPRATKPATAKPAATKPRATKPATAKPPAAAPAPRKVRPPKGGTAKAATNGSKASTEATQAADDDLLPTDGAKKRSRKAP